MTGRRRPHVGFVSTRLAGTDGVSLETAKWAKMLAGEGYQCFFFAGELDHPSERCYLVEEAHFEHQAIREIYDVCFGVMTRPAAVTARIHQLKNRLKRHLAEFVNAFGVEVLIPENALAIPLNLPLGLALTEFIAETGIPTIAHHHDLFWERKRFLTNAVWDYLAMAFPPHLPAIQHVVINSSADNQLSLRTGISATLIPNVMDFDHPPGRDNYGDDLRTSLGLQPEEYLVLQPTRVVKRKGIEHAIELLSRIELPAVLVISHASGDEGYGYEERVRDYSRLLGVRTLMVSEMIQPARGRTADGAKIYAPSDVYQQADLVTYPSTFEGFGNAFLEALYYRVPLVVNNYSIYAYDIKPKGFRTIEIDDYVDEATVQQTRHLLEHPELREQMTQWNYRLGRRYYSFSVARQKLNMLLANCFGIDGSTMPLAPGQPHQ